MGRLLAALLLPSALVAGRPQPSSGVDVLNRTLLLLESGSSALLAPAQLVQVAAADVPSDVATALQSANVSWSQLSDVMRVGVLWAHGYALVGASSTQLAPVYTYCDAPGDALDAVNGRYMDETVVAASDFAAAKCSSNTCGTFQQATNANCDETALARAITCAVDTNATKIPSSGASFWSNASSLSSVPVPKLFMHTLSSSKNLTLVSIHMASSVGATTQCGSSGDAVAPCFVLDDANKKNFCRPKIDGVPFKTLLETIAAKLAPTPAPTTPVDAKSSSSSGLSIGAIIGIAAGAAVVLGLVGFYFFRKKKNEPEPDYPGVGRKSSVGGGLHGSGPAFVAIHEKKKPSGVRRQGTSTSSNFPVIDSGRDNDTVQTTDYMDNLDEDSRQRPFTRNLLQSGDQSMLQSGSDMMRSGRSDSLINSFRGEGGKTIEDYCEESEIIREFLNDPVIKLRRIPYEELTTLRILSKGSYGEVYLGQLETRHVAMKRLLPEKKHLTKSIELFTGEIRIMCYLEHRNIVTFVGVSWNYLQNICVVVEYMDNGDLAEVLTKMKNKYTWEKEKIGIAMDIAEGLVYLHSMRPVIVHRDLKSKNVLLNKRGQAKLSDFGVSRKTTVNETMTSGVGTLLWTAPEIIEGRKYSEKADIFSLGVVLSEIDTCEEPYSTVTNEETGERLPGMQIVQMVRTGQLTVSLRDGCPAKIRELVQQCTSLDPDKRPTSMEVAYTLKSIIAPSLRATQ